MKTILLFGAGKSATCLIEYLGNCCEENDWKLLVCDTNIEVAESKIKAFKSAKALSIDVSDEKKRHEIIFISDIVISMLPPALHFLVAKDCVQFSKDLLTASYLDENIQSLQKEVLEKGLLFLGEMGLDPGIDHMSAMKMINEIKNEGGEISSFKSHCGGLVAPESDDNPWHYKITWNPANVVRAGSSGAVYKEDGKIIEVPYSKIFADDTHQIDVPELSPLSWYANRDSLSYLKTYDLAETSTFIRTTLRYPAFCRGWNKIVALDLTNNSDQEEILNCKTFAEWFLLKKEKLNLENEVDFFDQEFLQQIDFLTLRSNKESPFKVASSATILQYLLERKLVMQPFDKDMIVMLHEIEYEINNEKKRTSSCLIVKGEDQLHTAMAKTVGLPLAIATKLILQKKINLNGLHIPVIPEIYEPVLEELKLNGIEFKENTIAL
jgi:saccharopine dehydrogenase (NADP+, L-glutamate forming)